MWEFHGPGALILPKGCSPANIEDCLLLRSMTSWGGGMRRMGADSEWRFIGMCGGVGHRDGIGCHRAGRIFSELASVRRAETRPAIVI